MEDSDPRQLHVLETAWFWEGHRVVFMEHSHEQRLISVASEGEQDDTATC